MNKGARGFAYFARKVAGVVLILVGTWMFVSGTMDFLRLRNPIPKPWEGPTFYPEVERTKRALDVLWSQAEMERKARMRVSIILLLIGVGVAYGGYRAVRIRTSAETAKPGA